MQQKTDIFKNDIDKVHPNRICRKCEKIIRSVNAEYKTSQKRGNCPDGSPLYVLQHFFATRNIVFTQVTFKQHDDFNCDICARDPIIYDNEKTEIKRTDIESPSTRQWTDKLPRSTPIKTKKVLHGTPIVSKRKKSLSKRFAEKRGNNYARR